jgi:hypothetical protein
MRRPKTPVDWDRELSREQVLELRQARWRANSIHILKLVRKIVIAWLLLRHGADLSDAITTLTTTASH